MMGAIASVGFAWVNKLKRNGLSLSMDLPVNRKIDKRLVIGRLILGVG